MGFRKATYVLAVCDGCGPDWWNNTAEVAPHFENQLTARKQLAEEFGWRIVKRYDGRPKMFCPHCATRGDCELYGCAYPDPDVESGALRLQTCHRCSRVRRADDPPASHPDSVVPDLPEWLAALERELFPGEAAG